MLLDPPAIGARFGHDQAGNHSIDAPAKALGDVGRQPLLLVQLGERRLGVKDAGLDLRHRERSRGRVICEVVN